MLNNETHEELVRWRQYLISIIRSNSVEAPHLAIQQREGTKLTAARSYLRQPLIAANRSNGDDQIKQPSARNIRSDLKLVGPELQIWDD